MKLSSAAVALSTLLSPSFVVKAQQNPAGFPNPTPEWQLKCEEATQIVCGQSYTGNTSPTGGDDRVFSDTLSQNACGEYVENGIWFKMSVGQDEIFQLTLDTCSGTNFDTQIQLYSGSECGPGSGPDATMQCVDQNDDACGLQSILLDQNPLGDTDYWIVVEGFGSSSGPFQLDVTCSPVPDIDPWFIQRSAFPPPDVTNLDPLEGGTYLELNNARIVNGDVPNLVASIHSLPANGERCSEGVEIDSGLITLTNEPCPVGDPGCPLAMSGGTPVLQSFTIAGGFDPSLGIWFENEGNFDGQFRFCVETKLMLDYDPDTPGDEEVSYFETHYVVDVDFTSEKFIQAVAALPRNPANIDDLFDGFRVIPYLCGDDNEFPLNQPYDVTDPNDPDPANIADEFLVGENFRICLKPDVEFNNFEIVGFNDVKCYNAGEDRDIIDGGSVLPDEVLLTTIFTPTDVDKPAPDYGIAFESVVTSGFLLGGPSEFECHGTVELQPIPSSTRMLSNGRKMQEGNQNNLSGAFTVELTVVKPGLSTGAIAGISAAVAVVFLLVLFILYRRGCFAKRNKTNKPPKTIAVDENSDTTGDDPENASN